MSDVSNGIPRAVGGCTGLAVVVAGILASGLALSGCRARTEDAKGASPTADSSARTHVSASRPLMGTIFTIQVECDRAADGSSAIDAAFAELERIETLLSEWRVTSEISGLNRSAGGAAKAVGPELMEVVRRSLEISQLTGGAFDITFASCASLWSVRDRRVPRDDELAACLADRADDTVIVDSAASTLRLPASRTRIGIAGIGKGYGIDRAAQVLEQRGIASYIVDGGGDVRLRGGRADGPWRVGVIHPRAEKTLFMTFPLSHGSVATSGDYQQFFERDGVRFHHILDPRTGRPARTSIAATVIAPTATEADALATGLFVLGPDAGLELADSLPGVEALIFGPDAAPHYSSGFPRPVPSNER